MMLKLKLIFAFLFVASFSFSQKVEVKYDKERDFSAYKTFSLSTGEIFTPKGDRIYDEDQLKGWIREALIHELKEKGLTLVDAEADLHIDFVAGALQQSQFEDWGPLGYSQSPDPLGQGSSRTWSSKYNQGSIFLDVIDTKLNKVIWSCTASANLTEETDPQRLINELTMKSLKKFPIKKKKK